MPKLIEMAGFLSGRASPATSRTAQLDFETVKVRFFPPVMAFIEEGKRRHHSQKIKVCKDSTTAKPKYLITLSNCRRAP